MLQSQSGTQSDLARNSALSMQNGFMQPMVSVITFAPTHMDPEDTASPAGTGSGDATLYAPSLCEAQGGSEWGSPTNKAVGGSTGPSLLSTPPPPGTAASRSVPAECPYASTSQPQMACQPGAMQYTLVPMPMQQSLHASQQPHNNGVAIAMAAGSLDWSMGLEHSAVRQKTDLPAKVRSS